MTNNNYIRNRTYRIYGFFLVWFVTVEFIRLRATFFAWHELGRMPTIFDSIPIRRLINRQFDTYFDVFFSFVSLFYFILLAGAFIICKRDGVPVSKFVLWSYVFILLKTVLMRLGMLPIYNYYFWNM